MIGGQEAAGGRKDSSHQGGDSSKDSQGGLAGPALPAGQGDHGGGGTVEGGRGQAEGGGCQPGHEAVHDYL